MFIKTKQNLILIILILAATVAVMAALLLLKPQANMVMAQGGPDGANNYEAMGDQAPGGDFVVPPPGDIGPQSDGSGFEVVPIGAFRNDGDNPDGWIHYFFYGYIRNNGSDYACFMAPTYPPEGAELTRFFISFKDQSTTIDFYRFNLHRVALATGDVQIVAGQDPGTINWYYPNPTEGYYSVPSSMRTVTKDYAYYVDLCFEPDSDTDILLYGVRLEYTPATP
jgi:hypothetical protein